MMRLLLAAPFLLVMVLFALSNPQHINIGLWPTDLTVEAPLSLVVLVGLGFGFFFGALALWFSAVGARMRARRAEASVRRLEAQVNALRTTPGSAMAVLPPPA
jgi:putative membrane protein